MRIDPIPQVPQLSLRARRHAVASAAQRRLSAAAKAAAAAGTVVMAREPHGAGGDSCGKP